MENNVITEEPLHKKVFGRTSAEVKRAVLKRVREEYKKEVIEDLFSKGEKLEAKKMLARAFGKFLGEINHIAHGYSANYKTKFEGCDLELPTRTIPWSEVVRQHNLTLEFRGDEYYAKAFMEEYGIKVDKEDLLTTINFLTYGNRSVTHEEPNLMSKFDCLLSDSCPLPKQTLEKLLGKETITPIPPSYTIVQEGSRRILKKTKEIEVLPTVKQLTENGEKKQTSSTSNSEIVGDIADGTFVGAFAAGATSGVASAVAFGIEKGVEADNHKASITLASIAALLGIGCISASWIGKKFKSNKPSTRIRTYNLEKEYILNTETFLGIRVLIVDGERKEPINIVGGINDDVKYYNYAQNAFYHIRDLIAGNHEGLADMLPDIIQRELYIEIARSYIETNYQMMCDFPEIIEERMGYEEKSRDQLDINRYTRRTIYKMPETRAQFR